MCLTVTSNAGTNPQKLLDCSAHKSFLGWWFKELKKYTEDTSYHFQSTSDGMKFLWKDSWMCGRDLANRQRGSFRSAQDRRLSFFFSSVSKELYTKWYYWESLLFLIAVPRDQSSQEALELCSYISFSFAKREWIIALVVILVPGMQKASEKNSSHQHEVCKTSIWYKYSL